MAVSDTIVFWLVFFGINTLYFWPRYILDASSTEFIPVSGLLNGSIHKRLRWLIKRLNYDIFRWSTDFFSVVVIYIVFLRELVSPLAFSVVLYIFTGMTLLYQVYFTAFQKIYKVEPVLFNDLFVLKTAFKIFIYEFSRKNALILAFTVVFSVAMIPIIFAFVNLAADVEFGPWSLALIVILVVLMGYSALSCKYGLMPQCTFQSQVLSFIQNLRLSRNAKNDLQSLTLDKMKQFNINRSVELQQPPNIFLIMIESYGKVVIDDPDLKDGWSHCAAVIQRQLQDAGWEAASSLTRSPISGGSSWLSYTSVMYGLNVKSQGIFLTLMKNQRIQEYDSLFNWLHRSGYTTYRLSSLGGYKKMEIPYEAYSRLYGIDHWILHSDLNYVGREYGFGPSPPDQYSLNFANEMIRKQDAEPFALFFITQNSHTPYESPAEVAEDWRSLNSQDQHVDQVSEFWARPKFEKYGKAIEYQLNFISDFIVKQGRENDLFVLIGDHQPPSFKKDLKEFLTPMHIVSRDKYLLDTIMNYGFSPGMRPGHSVLHQAGILSMLQRVLITRYGNESAPVPEFLPEGIRIS